MGCHTVTELQPGLPIWSLRPLLVRRRRHNSNHPLRNPGRSSQNESALSTHSAGDCACPLGDCRSSGVLLLLLPDQHHRQRYAHPWRSSCDDCPHGHEHHSGTSSETTYCCNSHMHHPLVRTLPLCAVSNMSNSVECLGYGLLQGACKPAVCRTPLLWLA